jgi:hypothetical protein
VLVPTATESCHESGDAEGGGSNIFINPEVLTAGQGRSVPVGYIRSRAHSMKSV